MSSSQAIDLYSTFSIGSDCIKLDKALGLLQFFSEAIKCVLARTVSRLNTAVWDFKDILGK